MSKKKKRAKRAPISEFRRNTKRIRQSLLRSGEPLVLTCRGKAAVVVQDIDAYRQVLKLAAKAYRDQEIAAIREGIADVEAGRMVPAKQALKEIARKYGLREPGSK